MFLRNFLVKRILLSHYDVRCISRSSICAGNDSDGVNDAKKKLNSLLNSIIEEGNVDARRASKVEIPKPRVAQREKMKMQKKVVEKSYAKKLLEAAHSVAQSADGQETATEAELLHKVLHKDAPLKKEILEAAADNKKLSDLLSSMEVDTSSPPSPLIPKFKKNIREMTRSDQVKSVMRKPIYPKSKRSQYQLARVDLFSAQPLGILTPKKEQTEEAKVRLPTWKACEERELRLSISHPPSSYYEQMIHWTESGLLWRLPIDNEQDLEEEKKVSFEDHVFLEFHLEDWCPTTGPIRHFMELVCVGLSRNHWLTAAEKKEHIMWYKDYFTSKKALLKEVGAGDIQITNVQSVKKLVI